VPDPHFAEQMLQSFHGPGLHSGGTQDCGLHAIWSVSGPQDRPQSSPALLMTRLRLLTPPPQSWVQLLHGCQALTTQFEHSQSFEAHMPLSELVGVLAGLHPSMGSTTLRVLVQVPGPHVTVHPDQADHSPTLAPLQHGFVLHARCVNRNFEKADGQGLPVPTDWNLMLLRRSWMPPPHFCVHTDHFAHLFRTQSCGGGIGGGVHEVTSTVGGHSSPFLGVPVMVRERRFSPMPPLGPWQALHLDQAPTFPVQEHFATVQDADFVKVLEHLPPQAAGVLITLVFCLVPAPQFAEHLDHSDQSDILQLDGQQLPAQSCVSSFAPHCFPPFVPFLEMLRVRLRVPP